VYREMPTSIKKTLYKYKCTLDNDKGKYTVEETAVDGLDSASRRNKNKPIC